MTFRRRRLTTRQREDLYERERAKAVANERGEFPICNICDQPVVACQTWDESHHPAFPHALGGTDTGVAHTRCNRRHGAEVVVPQVARSKRQFKMARDINRSRNPLPGGRDDPRRRTVAGLVVDRATGEPWRTRR